MQNDIKIALTGFMGVGKSSVARHLAHKLRSKWIDLDRSIEDSEGRVVAKMIQEKKNDREIVEDLFLRVFGRMPNDKEWTNVQQAITELKLPPLVANAFVPVNSDKVDAAVAAGPTSTSVQQPAWSSSACRRWASSARSSTA